MPLPCLTGRACGHCSTFRKLYREQRGRSKLLSRFWHLFPWPQGVNQCLTLASSAMMESQLGWRQEKQGCGATRVKSILLSYVCSSLLLPFLLYFCFLRPIAVTLLFLHLWHLAEDRQVMRMDTIPTVVTHPVRSHCVTSTNVLHFCVPQCPVHYLRSTHSGDPHLCCLTVIIIKFPKHKGKLCKLMNLLQFKVLRSL